MTEQQSTPRDALKKAILQLASEWWQKTKRVYLLSTLGKDLLLSGIDVKDILQREKLATFIGHELSGELNIVISPKDKLVHGLLPKSITGDVAEFFQQHNAPKKRGIEFDRHLWLGFVRPLGEGQVRLVDLEPSLRYEDVAEAAAKDSKKLRIGRERIVSVKPAVGVDRNSAIVKNIEEWLKENQIPLDKVKAKQREIVTGNSALEVLINLFDEADLKRVSIPMDVVAKLIKKKGG